MLDLIDTNVTGRTDTDAREPFRVDPERVAHDVERTKRDLVVQILSSTIPVTFVPSGVAYLQTGDHWDAPESLQDYSDVDEAHVAAWTTFDERNWQFGESIERLTRATNSTSTTVSSVASLLRRHHRDERLRRMSPEALATYDRIRRLREEIGPVEFDVLEALRELRDDG